MVLETSMLSTLHFKIKKNLVKAMEDNFTLYKIASVHVALMLSL